MYCKTFDEGESFSCAGNEYLMLLPRDVTHCAEMAMERISVGGGTPPNAHDTYVQVLIILQGEAEITIGDGTRRVSAPATAFIPRNTTHHVVNSGQVELRYVYISIWPTGIPREEMEGGWKKACTDMIQDYADRGFPPRRTSE